MAEQRGDRRPMDLLAGLVRATEPTASDEDVLRQAVQTAVEFVPGAVDASLCRVAGGLLETVVSIGPTAAGCEQLQRASGRGPCISAVVDAEVVRIDDMADDRRWPDFAEQAVELGVQSMIACPLATWPESSTGLTVYSAEAHAFEAAGELTVVAYAGLAGLLIGARERERNLVGGLETRQTIGEAMGILMERHRLPPGQAFDLLVTVSQRQHVKLRDVAEELTRTGSLPDT